jgi:hypothetical protein
MKKLFDNRGMERRPSLVSFGRFESSRGKGLSGRRILGWWSRQMSLAHQGRKGKGNFPQVESPGKLGVKDLGSNLSKMSLGHERGFKILPNNDAKMLSHKL